MPVNVIGTLKPKNNGKFPVAEAVDIKVTDDLRLDEALENKADLSTVNYALNNKADKTTTDSLQEQIYNIIEPVTEDAEVINAREGADGTSYQTLKARLDGENAKVMQFRGELSDLNYLTIAEATQIGCYNSRSTTTADLSDKPDGVSGPFSLYVNKWSSGDALGTVQLLISSSGAVYQRFLSYSGNIIIDWASTAPTIAEHSEEIRVLKNEIYEFVDISMNLTYGKFWDISGEVAELKDIESWYASAVIPVSEGEIYTVYADQGSSHKTRVWTLCDDNLFIIARSEDVYDDKMIEESFVVPNGATKLIISHKSHQPDVPYLKKQASKFDEINSDIYNYSQETVTFVLQGMNEQGRSTSSTTRTRTGLIASNTDILTIQAATGYKFRAAYYTDSAPIETATFSHFSTWYTGNGEDVKLETGYYIRLLCGYADDSTVEDVTDFAENIFVFKATNRITELEDNIYLPKGLKLSLLGDSISAYAGTIPEGNDVYYTGSNSGVSSPDQMWWKVLCDKTDMIPLIINGYSGSGITQLTDSAHASKVPMSDTTRDQALHSGTTTPDIVIIAGGVNDYTYAEQASQLPNDWDGKTAPVKGNSFTETYACMIKDIQTAYPNAIIICLSTWFTMRGTDNGYTLLNDEGYTQADYRSESVV